MFKKKNDKPLIRFVSTVTGLETITECIPKPAKFYTPDWFKNVPGDISGSVRKCPSFPDYFSQGYIIPMWSDTKISYDQQSKNWTYLSASKDAIWEAHTNNQLIDHVTPNFTGNDGEFVFKALCPWKIITPPGYSVLQLPLFYHFNQDISIFPGVIDTDIYHDINQQVLYHGKGKEVLIKRGDPFALYIPFERKKYQHSVEALTEEYDNRFKAALLNIYTKFSGEGSYRQMQRERDAKQS